MNNRCRVDATLSLRVNAPGKLAAAIAISDSVDIDSEAFTCTGEAFDEARPPKVVEFPHGTRIHVLDLGKGELTIRYTAERALHDYPPEPLTYSDLIEYTRPSRYCPSDRIGNIALAEFGHLVNPLAKVRGIVRFVSERLVYTPGSSTYTDDAIDTLLAGQGVCRDYAHLCIALCRSLDIPARFVAVYAPGLSPMDFHAVFEAAIDGRWYVFDASRLAPRQSMTRIATGRDAADGAFLSTLGCEIDFTSSTVTATVDPELPTDDGTALMSLR